MALLRIRTPEQLQGQPPGELGILLGLDRAPEVKTLRRKLGELAARRQATSFSQRLAERWVRDQADAVGLPLPRWSCAAVPWHGPHAGRDIRAAPPPLPAGDDRPLGAAAGCPATVRRDRPGQRRSARDAPHAARRSMLRTAVRRKWCRSIPGIPVSGVVCAHPPTSSGELGRKTRPLTAAFGVAPATGSGVDDALDRPLDRRGRRRGHGLGFSAAQSITGARILW